MADEAMQDIGRYQPSARIRAELGMPLHLEFEGVRARVAGVLVGMEVDQYLIIKLTGALEAVASRLFKGNLLVVRYIYEGTVYGFQCKSLGSVATPARLLFASYPTIVAEQTIRARHRSLCRLPVRLQLAAEEVSGLLLDVNTSGGRVSFVPQPVGPDEEPELPQVDEVVSMTLKLPGSTDMLGIAGSIRNRRVDSHGCQLGLAFEPLDEATAAMVSAFMQEMDAAD